MGQLLLSIAALILSVTILLAGNSLQFVILGLRAEAEGLPVSVVGAMTAGYFLGYGLGTLQAPRIVDVIGHIRTFAAMCSIISAIVLAHGLWVEPIFWVALRFVTGLCFAGLATVIESWINAKATRASRGRLLSIAMLAGTMGYSVGPLFAGLSAVQGFTLFVIASILMSLALVPITLTRVAAPAVSGGAAPVERYTLRRLFRETPLGLVGCVATGVVQGAVLGLGAVFAGRVGLSDTAASLFMAGTLAAGALAQYPLGWLSDLFDRRLVIAAAGAGIGATCLGVAAALGAAPAAPAAMPLIVLAGVAAGAAAMPLYPLVIAHVNDRLPEHSIVPAAATLILSFSVGSAVAGPIASEAMTRFGPAGLFLLIGLTLIGFAGFTAVRARVREAPPETTPEEGVVASNPTLAPFDAGWSDTQLEFDFEAGPPGET
jgi:MFS family permease